MFMGFGCSLPLSLNNISLIFVAVLLVEETGVPEEYHQPAVTH
jgi:hypothetical protein